MAALAAAAAGVVPAALNAAVIGAAVHGGDAGGPIAVGFRLYGENDVHDDAAEGDVGCLRFGGGPYWSVTLSVPTVRCGSWANLIACAEEGRGDLRIDLGPTMQIAVVDTQASFSSHMNVCFVVPVRACRDAFQSMQLAAAAGEPAPPARD
jgi:hypothetical protein